MGNGQFSFASMVKNRPTVESRCQLFSSIQRQDLLDYLEVADQQYKVNKRVKVTEPVGELKMVTAALTQMWLDAGHTVKRTLDDLDSMAAACEEVKAAKGRENKMGVFDVLRGLATSKAVGESVHEDNGSWSSVNMKSKQRDMSAQMSQMHSTLHEAISLQSNIDTLKREQIGNL